MADKIVDIDPRMRLTKEALNRVKKEVAEMKLDEIGALTIIFTPLEGPTSVKSFGLDWATLGVSQAILSALAHELLSREYESIDRV